MTNPLDVVLDGGATLHFVTSANAIDLPEQSLPNFQVSGLPGARIALRRGFVDDGLVLHVACVEAPSDRWAPGIEDVVFGLANHVAHRALSERVAIERWDVSAPVFRDQHFEQQPTGTGTRQGSAVKLWGKHLLGFEGERRDVVLCSVLCDDQPERNDCSQLVGAATITGLVPAPPPSVLVRSVLFAAEEPLQASALIGVLGTLVVGVILAKRPRPKP